MKKISIIVPVYNGISTIHRCVDSLLAQTLAPGSFEILLIDDCSTDNTLSILKEYEDKYPTLVRVFQTPQNLRQGGARNIGINKATGDYIGFVDADDWAEPVMYEHMLNKAYAYDCDVVCCHLSRDTEYRLNTPDEFITGEDLGIIIETNKERSDFIASHIFGNQVTRHIYCREFLLQNDIFFPEHLAYEDNLFEALVYLSAKRVYLLEEQLYHYYVNESSTVLTKDAAYHKDFFTIGALCWDAYKTRNALSLWKEACEFDFIMQYFVQGLKLLALRYSTPQIDGFKQLKNDVLARINSPETNTYIEPNTNEFQKLQIQALSYDMSDNEIADFLEQIKAVYHS